MENQNIDKSDGFSDSLKDKIGLSVFLKKISFFGACGFVNIFIFLIRNVYKSKFKIENDYINAYLNIIDVINNHLNTTIVSFFVAILVYFLLYYVFSEVANKYSSEVFWSPYETEETNSLKQYWNKFLRSTIFYKRITGKGIVYFVSGKYLNWVENAIIALKRIGLFVLKVEALFFTFLYLKGNAQLMTMMVIYVTFAAALFDSYRLVFVVRGIPLQINLYNLANNFIILNEFEGYFNDSETPNGKESGIYRIMKYRSATSEIYYLIFFSTNKVNKELPSIEERFLSLKNNGVKKYHIQYKKETHYFLYPELDVICYSNSYVSILNYVKNSKVLSGGQTFLPIRIN